MNGFVIEATRKRVSSVTGCGSASEVTPAQRTTLSPPAVTPATTPGTPQRAISAASSVARASGAMRREPVSVIGVLSLPRLPP